MRIYIYIYKADTYTCIYYIFQITISIHPVHPKPYLCEYTSLAEIIVYNIYIYDIMFVVMIITYYIHLQYS